MKNPRVSGLVSIPVQTWRGSLAESGSGAMDSPEAVVIAACQEKDGGRAERAPDDDESLQNGSGGGALCGAAAVHEEDLEPLRALGRNSAKGCWGCNRRSRSLSRRRTKRPRQAQPLEKCCYCSIASMGPC